MSLILSEATPPLKCCCKYDHFKTTDMINLQHASSNLDLETHHCHLGTPGPVLGVVFKQRFDFL